MSRGAKFYANKLKFFLLSFIFGIFFASFILPLKNIWRISFLDQIKIWFSESSERALMILGIVILYSFLLFYDSKIKLAWRQRIFWVLLILFFVFGIFRFNYSILSEDDSANINFYNGQEMKIQGVVQNIIEKPNSRQIILVPREIAGSERKVRGKILLVLDKDKGKSFLPGDVLVLEEKIEPIEDFTPDFSYKNYLEKDDVYSQILFPADLVKVDQAGGTKYFLKRNLFQLKIQMGNNLGKFIPDHRVQGWLASIFLGDRQELSDRDQDNFRKAGLAHVLAISGLHVGIFSLMVFGIFLYGFQLSKKWTLFLASGVVIFYISMIGNPASATRAGIMGLVLVFAVAAGRLYDFKNSLLLAASIILFLSPKYLRYDLGFQLSFLSLLGIFYLYPKFQKLYLAWAQKRQAKQREKLRIVYPNLGKKLPKVPNALTIIFVSLSAQMATMPLVFPVFKTVSFVAPLANVLVLPVLPIFLAGAILVSFLGFLSPTLAGILGGAISFFGEYLLRLVEILASLPGAYWEG